MTIYVAACLKYRFPEVYSAIKYAPGVEHKDIEGTRNIWCRDYMPVPRRGGGYALFDYDKYGGNYPQLEVRFDAVIDPLLDDLLEDDDACHHSNLKLDHGGNCVCCESNAIVTDIVYEHNPDSAPKSIRNQLEHLLNRDVIIIPREPCDALGHSDGIVKFIEPGIVFLNDYTLTKDPLQIAYMKAVEFTLRNHGIEAVPFPYGYHIRDGISEEEAGGRPGT